MTASSVIDQLSRQVRILVLLESCEAAGLVPVPVERLHLLAYLANALAPVWNMAPMDGSLLKKRHGPYYPELQSDVDRMIGRGLVRVIELGHWQDERGAWRVTGSFSLNQTLARPALEAARAVQHPDAASAFIRELVFAVSALHLDFTEGLAHIDATYADPLISIGNVIDFGEWRDVNYSANAARHFLDFLPGQLGTPAELTHMYFRLAAARAAAEV